MKSIGILVAFLVCLMPAWVHAYNVTLFPATFDQWFSIGFGAVIAFYRLDGSLLRSVDIEDLYGSDELRQIPRSKSSRSWRCKVHTTAVQGYPTTISFYDYFGNGWVLDPKKATTTRAPTRGQCDPSGQSLTFQ